MKHNRRILFLLLIPALAISLCACSGAPAASVTAPAADAPEASDTAAFDAAVRAVEEEFVTVINEGLDAFDEDAHPELPFYTAVLTRYEENSYYAARHDFDGNGTDELLIGVGDAQTVTPIAVFAFDGAAMRYLCKEAPLGERSHLGYRDGLLIVRGSDGAASGSLTFYRIARDGWSTDIVDIVDYEFSGETQVSFTSRMKKTDTEELAGACLADGIRFDLALDWVRFYPADPA